VNKKALSRLNILIVDDDKFILNLCLRVLRIIGCENFEIAENGHLALEKFTGGNKPFDVIIFDLNMPEMDGIELIGHFAKHKFRGGIILLSGMDDRFLETAHNHANKSGLNVLGTVQKPLTANAISKLLKSYEPREDKLRKYDPEIPITEEELQTGLEGEELQPVFQPKVNIITGEVTGVEALSRWNHADRGILGPGAFVPLAEKNGLIDDLTYAIYRKIMRQAGVWLSEGIRIKVSVNVSINTFLAEGFSDFLVDTAFQEGIEPEYIILEVTESQLMENANRCLELLMRLRLKRLSLSIDDFGTGYSSLDQLNRIPFTEMKIDRSFVNSAANSTTAYAILESSINLARKLNMEIVAEGVETRDEWDLVAELGCDYVQGYYIAKPMPSAEFQSWLKNYITPERLRSDYSM